MKVRAWVFNIIVAILSATLIKAVAQQIADLSWLEFGVIATTSAVAGFAGAYLVARKMQGRASRAR